MTYRQLLAQTRAVDRRFYERPAPEVARELLGKIIIHKLDGQARSGPPESVSKNQRLIALS